MHDDVLDVLNLLERNENEEYRVGMKAYMKDQFEFYGVKAPKRKILIRPFIKKHSKSDFNLIKTIIGQLWDFPVRDAQYVAMELLSKHLKHIEEEDIELIEYLITTKSWWDTVDWVAAHAAGRYFIKFDARQLEIIDRWSNSDDIWLIRSTIIHQLFYKEATDKELMAALILDQKGSKEFFINKACGWALRQYSKSNPVWVENFINENERELNNLSIREGMKWILKNKK